MLNYGIIKKIDLRLTMCLLDMLSWCQHKVHFWYIRSCFFFHTMFWRKKSVSAFFFGFTSRAMRVVLLTSLDLLLTFTGEYYWRSTEALGLLLLFEDTIIFSDKQQFQIHTFPYKMADFWTFRLLLNVLGQIRSWSKKTRENTSGSFPTTTENKSEQYY